MTINRSYQLLNRNNLRQLLLILYVCISISATAQINISGSVYGGARQADVGGSTSVTVGADYHDVIIKAVYGGSDISGTIGSTKGTRGDKDANLATFKEADGNHIFIGQFFGGGNGDYQYKDANGNELKDAEGKYYIVKDADGKVVAESEITETTTSSPFVVPVIGTVALNLCGGTFGYVYGGGNNATVKTSSDITINNESAIWDINGTDNTNASDDVLSDDDLRNMGINTAYFNQNGEYHFSRVFGGNNKAVMHIHPTWHLNKGKIENLYSGGNEGAMTSPTGLLLEIPESSDITINNLYGGCRKADVVPKDDDGNVITNPVMAGYPFPDGFSAHIRILGGNITNVYGGNDVSGRVAGGCTVGIYHSIIGDVYGGGNGSYPYTDNGDLKKDLVYGDFYYDKGSKSSVVALNEFRPNAEQVSIFVSGKVTGSTSTPTIIGGSIYCGGNSATLSSTMSSPLVELKIGPYVRVDKVFLGNNGENMVNAEEGGVLRQFKASVAGSDKLFNSMDLTDKDQFATYMEGAAMSLIPKLTFDPSYEPHPYSTYIGSLYCGGNVGSMTYPGTNKMEFKTKVVIFEKVVGGCNNANVNATAYNARYEGGIKTALTEAEKADNPNKLELIFEGLKIEPKRWNADKTVLVWNTIKKEKDNSGNVIPIDLTTTEGAAYSIADRRLYGGNIYGGCYNSGYVNGNVVINIEESIVDRDEVFDAVIGDGGEGIYYADNYDYTVTSVKSGVQLGRQGVDVDGAALNVFGGGYGKDSEIWGSTTINLKKGYAFQVFGGGEQGAIGKKKMKADGTPDLDSNGEYQYDYNPVYSTYLNLIGATNAPGVSMKATASANMPECEYIYGGGYQGLITGDTHINLGNGRIFNSFAGSCNADVLGHTETYIGSNGGFPWVRDHVYGGNDLGGSILNVQPTGENAPTNNNDFTAKVSDFAKPKVHGYIADNQTFVLKASAYMEYVQGRVDRIFGGCFGDYDYNDYPTVNRPYMENTFVNFKPNSYSSNSVSAIFGAGQGHTGTSSAANTQDAMQDHSYVLIDVPDAVENFMTTDVFGAGACCGVGMRYKKAQTIAEGFNLDQASAIVDLIRGHIHDAYGASYEEGFTRRTMVNVPTGSKAQVYRIFGGGYGLRNTSPCDTYEANINWNSNDALVGGYRTGIFGGNNNYRRTLYSIVNINAPLWSDKEKTSLATVFGAGLGENTWTQYTEVNLNNGAQVYEVYGGGNAGMVLNKESVDAWVTETESDNIDNNTIYKVIGSEYTDLGLEDPLVKVNGMDKKCNTNVYINEGANVSGYMYNGSLSGAYAYGGGLGATAIVAGSAYIGLHGGTVAKDIYASGSNGGVLDYYGVKGSFVATANAYIEGGSVRNVYGGGWRGGVGKHIGDISEYANNETDIDGESHVVIGKDSGTTFTDGVPAIARNVYGGGEGGSVFGTAYVTINNGYIGYSYNSSTGKYDDVDDDAPGDGQLKERGGSVFGGAYVANSFVDRTVLTMYGGTVRGSLYGGGEVGAIGRGYMKTDAPSAPINNSSAKIYLGGGTQIYMYGGHVMKDVFGGGRGYDNWGKDGRKFMSDAEIAIADFNAKGFVFGSTDVHIRGGIVGTEAGAFKNHGNVFGGGNEGFVYSATGKKVGSDRSDEHLTNGLPTDGGGFYYIGGNTDNELSLDCNVVVEPYCLVTADDGISGLTANESNGIKASYDKGEYVPVEALNQLKNNDSRWASLDNTGITIYNAVFAGGNIKEGSDIVNANTPTVFGNAAASLRDAYNRDFITVGTNDMGGIYGDGNLTLVDGFREVHIDNYGTDYYYLSPTVTLDQYNNDMSPREQAYYQLKFVTKQNHTYSFWESKSLHTYNGTTYKKGQKITPADYDNLSADEQNNWTAGTKGYVNGDEIDDAEYILMDATEQAYWVQSGVFSIYAGRLLNTIQRADMCGVFGSRMVLKGAEDRVPQVLDYSNYTINRVDEVSLNKRVSPAGDTDDVNKVHGNYFGIYSSVNYLGNLTSDVSFDDIRKADTDNNDLKADGTTTYYGWKTGRPQNKYRNNGTCHNKVALASGVYLEIKREEGEATGVDDWGYITGVIELDLINVMPGMGGGYVYAKNEHGKMSYYSSWGKVTLLNENITARTYRHFTYNESTKEQIETSGNFIHFNKQIVDDCYPNGGIYNDGYVQSPAHYWFIKGSIYVYDQYISAYTGAANAYAEKIEMPLTITAASNGKMTLREVQPNYYAYYDKNGNKLGDEASNAEESFVINNKPYYLNDPISYWDYRLLSEADKFRFVEETYTTIAECTVTTSEGTTTYAKGYTLLPDEYTQLKNASLTKKLNEQDTKAVHYVHNVEENKDVAFDFVFRPSNNMSHNTGYVLTFDINNPMIWNNYYTKTESPGQANSKNTEEYDKLSTSDKNLYTEGPTYTPKTGKSGVYGQRQYKTGEVVNANTYQAYVDNVSGRSGLTDQASVERAYIVKTECTVTDKNGQVQYLHEGAPVAESNYTQNQWTAMASYVEAAKQCTSLLQFTVNDYIYPGKLLTSAEISDLKAKAKAMNSGWSDQQASDYVNGYLADAYLCTAGGLYGGSYFEAGKAYRVLDTWSNMSKEERENFTYNYDAFDVLVDSTYSDRLESHYGDKPQYDGYSFDPRYPTSPQYTGWTPLPNKVYSVTQPIDYRAEYKGETQTFTIKKNGTSQTVTLTASSSADDWLLRTDYESLPNEKHHYSPITVTSPGNYYVVKEAFMRGDIPYTIGQVIEASTYNAMTDQQKEHIDVISFTEAHTVKDDDDNYVSVNYFYCREPYYVDEKGQGVAVTTMGIKSGTSATTYSAGQQVPMGVIINQDNYSALKNFQHDFVIHGTSPTEVSTLYVSSESDIFNLSKEKIITVIYLYEYEESDESGMNVVPVSERHVVNIHVSFKSGVPQIGDLNKPSIVLPGTTLAMDLPTVTQGAYKISGSGWELFSSQGDADTGTNGQPYVNNSTPVYWYQNNYWIAYYAETYLGKTYSSPVQISVANYHDLSDVMADKTNHMFIDHHDVERDPKIYIDQTMHSGENQLDLLKDLYTLSIGGSVTGHTTSLDETQVGGLKNLEFILRSDLTASENWTSLGSSSSTCFGGTLHGDGHTIGGLKSSLFNDLCGEVYNLGVTGSFTGAGIAETGRGYVENCWVSTTRTPASGVYAVFGNPTRSTTDSQPVQVVNCYYPESNHAYTVPTSTIHGQAIQKADEAFYNGEVAYDLNEFYLFKRYCDNQKYDNTEDLSSYSYWKEKTDASDALELKTGYYENQEGPYLTGTEGSYVENRYADGDFIYAAKTIPDTDDDRLYKDENEQKYYYPIWPDDYIFFGQTLNYGHIFDHDHQEVPSAVHKDEKGRLETDEDGNRVYRATGYFGSSTDKKAVHFNPYAVFAKTKNGDANVKAFEGMTAIDLMTEGSTYGYRADDTDLFYPPLLDDDGLTKFRNIDLTRNLLVYTGTNSKTASTVERDLPEPVYAEDDEDYRTVAPANTQNIVVQGHWVNNGLATVDHLLVDDNDFNAPISYKFVNGKHMWYQHTPERYVTMEDGSSKGWEDICLPFEVELVTTQTKGEISHFYQGSTFGHEYWLRELTNIKNDVPDDLGIFLYPEPTTNTKEYKNTFLYDHYYNSMDTHSMNHDKNHDDYQDQYYDHSHTYSNYPLQQAGKPYLIGYPGPYYYEFDLSGAWTPSNSASSPSNPGQQTITFASKPGARIAVSDSELQKEEYNGYLYCANYKHTTVPVTGYLLDEEGRKYASLSAATEVKPFRPYFELKPLGNARDERASGSDNIMINQDMSSMKVTNGIIDTDEMEDLLIKTSRKKIQVTSLLRHEVEVRIVTPSGVALTVFNIEPGETVETRVNNTGVYIIYADNGKYVKKLILK